MLSTRGTGLECQHNEQYGSNAQNVAGQQRQIAVTDVLERRRDERNPWCPWSTKQCAAEGQQTSQGDDERRNALVGDTETIEQSDQHTEDKYGDDGNRHRHTIGVVQDGTDTAQQKRFEPTERSISPAMMTKTMPDASRPVIAI